MALQAIPTTFDGINYRSRLEARVAMAFKKAHISFEYEPEAFQLGNIQYCPDFYLNAAKCWIEVKPTWKHCQEDKKAKALADAGERVFYAFPEDDFSSDMPNGSRRLLVMSVRGTAIWTRCSYCSTMQPWPLQEDYECLSCGVVSGTEEWFKWYWTTDYPLGMPLPQYQHNFDSALHPSLRGANL